jgi:hypothetical protein
MKNKIIVLIFSNIPYYTIYNIYYKILFELEIKNNSFIIINNDYDTLDTEIVLSHSKIHFYYEHIKYLLFKGPIILDMHIRIILTKLNILNDNS